MSLFKRKPKSEHVPEPPVVLPVQSNIYEFIIKSENDESALSATKTVYEKLNVLYLKEKDKFRFFGCMKAPLKKLQNQKSPICTVRRFINTLLSMCPSNCRLSWEMMVPL